MSELTNIIVLVAAITYIGKQLATAISAANATTVMKRFDAIEALHVKAENDIEPTFELWWEDGPSQAARQKIIERMTSDLPEFISPEAAEEITRPMTNGALRSLRGLALHLALHAHIREDEATMMAKLPKLGHWRQRAIARREEHENELNQTRVVMLDHDIDPASLEQYFTKKA
jgi:hypothetical protein